MHVKVYNGQGQGLAGVSVGGRVSRYTRGNVKISLPERGHVDRLPEKVGLGPRAPIPPASCAGNLRKHFQSNPEFVIADLDVSQNKLTLEQLPAETAWEFYGASA